MRKEDKTKIDEFSAPRSFDSDDALAFRASWRNNTDGIINIPILIRHYAIQGNVGLRACASWLLTNRQRVIDKGENSWKEWEPLLRQLANLQDK